MSKYTRVFNNDDIVVEVDNKGNYRVSFYKDDKWQEEHFFLKERTKDYVKVDEPYEEETPNLSKGIKLKRCNPTNNTYTYIPECCRGCPSHPSNGGSGICYCSAPLFDLENPYRVTC